MTTDIIKTISRIDPTESFIEYVNTVKPYHTKILDVVMEYVHADTVAATVRERMMWEVVLTRPLMDTVFSCGYGIVWDPFIESDAPDNIFASIPIIRATSSIPAPMPDNIYSESFLVGPLPTPIDFPVATVSAQSNQMALVQTYAISSVDLLNNRWLVVDGGSTLVAQLTTNVVTQKFIISTNSGTGNGEYTISGTPFNSGGITYITCVETLPIQSTNDGNFHRILRPNEVPSWQTGTAIAFSVSGGTLPAPIAAGTQYYFIPTAQPGYFNVAHKRYPSRFEDYVDLTAIGSGTLTAHRNECFQPGMSILVTGTQSNINNGQYMIRDVTKEGSNERLNVYQHVPQTTTGNPSTDGQVAFKQNGYDDPTYCPPARMDDLRAEVFIDERIVMVFDLQNAVATSAVSTTQSATIS